LARGVIAPEGALSLAASCREGARFIGCSCCGATRSTGTSRFTASSWDAIFGACGATFFSGAGMSEITFSSDAGVVT